MPQSVEVRSAFGRFKEQKLRLLALDLLVVAGCLVNPLAPCNGKVSTNHRRGFLRPVRCLPVRKTPGISLSVGST